MTKDRRLDKIIEDNLPALKRGQETVESILNKYPKEAGALRPRFEAILWLNDASKDLAPRQGFIPSSRKYLEQRLQSIPPRSIWQLLASRFTPRRWVFNLTAPVVLLALIALVVNNLVLTARLSIPGDPFYSTKLIIEDIQLAFTFSPENKTDLYIQFSRERTAEFVDLVLDGDYELLPTAANRMEIEIISSLRSLNTLSALKPTHEIAMVAEFRETLSNEISLLDMLRISSPSSARPGIDLAIQVARSGVMALH